jgi:hypothetical protein
MTKKNEQATGLELSIDLINDNVQAVSIGAEEVAPISMAEAFAFFKDADDKQFITLGGAEYLDFEKLQIGKYVYLFTGITSWKGKDQRTGEEKVIPAVQLTDEEGKEFICAAKLIVDNCSQITQMPCLIRVVHGGKKKASSGNMYFDLKVQVGPASVRG